MTDKLPQNVEELLAAHKVMVAAMSPKQRTAYYDQITTEQIAHARANPYKGGERQAQAMMPKGFAVADTDPITAEFARAAIAAAARLTARVAELEGVAGAMFAAQDAYLSLPTDRGGATGPKGTASYKFMLAMAELRAALAKEEPTP